MLDVALSIDEFKDLRSSECGYESIELLILPRRQEEVAQCTGSILLLPYRTMMPSDALHDRCSEVVPSHRL